MGIKIVVDASTFAKLMSPTFSEQHIYIRFDENPDDKSYEIAETEAVKQI